MHYITGKNRDELLLFSHVDMWVNELNPVRLIDLVVDKIIVANKDRFEWKGLKDKGRKSYSPNTMLKLLLYGYINRISGSRRLEKETYRNIELMWLIGDLHPDHWTICSYRSNNADQVRYITIEFRKFLKSTDYIDGKVQATDGTKLKAYASRDMLTLKQIEKMLENNNKKLTQYMEDSKEIDALEELKEDIENDNIKLEDKLSRTIFKLQEKITKLEADKKHLEESTKKYIAPNDYDASLVKSRDGKIAGYNGQIIVDNKHRLISLSDITTDSNDINSLKNNIESQEEQIGLIPEILEADKGYGNTTDIETIEASNKTTCFIPLQKGNAAAKDKKNGISFIYDEDKDYFTCSKGKTLKKITSTKKDGKHTYTVYRCNDCNKCPLRDQCTTSKLGRTKRINNNEWVKKYKKRMKEEVALERIKERKSIVEHPFGTIKTWMGKMPFLLTTKKKVQIEFDLYAMVYNLKRMEKIVQLPILMRKINNYSW